MLNHMVHFSADSLDMTFAALSDGNRRSILAHLAERGEVPVSELAGPLAITLQGVLKHVNVLVAAGLVTREKRGRTVHCRLQPASMRAATDWLAHYEKFWGERLDSLASFVEDEACRPQTGVTPRTPSPTDPGPDGKA
jgi:DNA-binding transcriptional ArsR family regulator